MDSRKHPNEIFKNIKLSFQRILPLRDMQQATTNVLPSTIAISDDVMEEKTQWIK